MSRYYDVDGKKLPSVTTILGCLNKPALMPWAVKMTIEAVQQLIHDNGIHNVMDGTITLKWESEDGRMGLEDILSEAKKSYRAKSTEAMDHGTRVHEAIQMWIESGGRMPPEEIPEERVREGLQAFLDWGDEHDIHVLSWEEMVTDGESYAGRYDLLAEIDGNVTLLDFKTSTSIYAEYWTQVNAYAACLLTHNCPPTHVAVLRIDKTTGEFEYQSQPIDMQQVEAFRHLAKYYNTRA